MFFPRIRFFSLVLLGHYKKLFGAFSRKVWNVFFSVKISWFMWNSSRISCARALKGPSSLISDGLVLMACDPVFVQSDKFGWTHQHMSSAGLNSSTEPKGSWVLVRIHSSSQHQWAVTRPHPTTHAAGEPATWRCLLPGRSRQCSSLSMTATSPWRRGHGGLQAFPFHATCMPATSSHSDPCMMSLFPWLVLTWLQRHGAGWLWIPPSFAAGLTKFCQGLGSKQCP